MGRPVLALFALASVTACAAQPALPAPHAATASPASPESTSIAPAAPIASTAPIAARATGYDQPPPAILDVLHAPSPPRPYVNPAGDVILLVSWVDYPSLAQVAEPYLRLAGVRVEPRTRRKHDTPGGYGVSPCARDAKLVRVSDGTEIAIALPSGCVESPLWAADGKHFAFRTTTHDAVEVWIGDGTRGEVHRLGEARLNPMLGSSTLQWMPDQKSLLVKLVPDDAGTPPATNALEGPGIQETTGQKGESSTYETRDTLTNAHDEELFDFYARSQLARVDVETGQITRIGKPEIVSDVDVAPDGEHLLVTSIHKPYSYVTTFDRFPHDVEVWNRDGAVLRSMASLPLADRVPVHGVPTGPRDFAWRATEPATLTWAEALDGGDWNAKVPARDKVMMQRAPFTNAPAEIMRTEQRFANIAWGEDPHLALVREVDDNRHWTRTFTFDAGAGADAKAKPSVLFDLSTDEHYKDPGRFVWRQLANGAWVVRQSGNAIYLSGTGSSSDGDRPFLDRLDLATRKSERLFRSDKAAYESFLAFADAAGRAFLTWHQSPSDPPNAFLRAIADAPVNAPIGEATYASTPKAVTHIPDPTPAVRAIKKRLVKYKRKDGTDLSFTLYTPPNYQEGTRVPAILYAYPLDYADASKAGQVTGSEQTFTRLAQYRLMLLAGYAIIDNAAFPIVGDPKKAYDHYIDQLVLDATAAVEKAIALGVVDPERIGVTGHSHGALMTVNLLAHSNLFRAGVATSGSYNKTLTPFGFQNERRSVWSAQNVYLAASPFFYADKLKLPLLLMHGTEDANPGTTPLQSQKLYEAIRGNGGTARLVLLPHEPHWYAAMESNEQYAFEMLRWFDTYVKNAAPRAKSPK